MSGKKKTLGADSLKKLKELNWADYRLYNYFKNKLHKESKCSFRYNLPKAFDWLVFALFVLSIVTLFDTFLLKITHFRSYHKSNLVESYIVKKFAHLVESFNCKIKLAFCSFSTTL